MPEDYFAFRNPTSRERQVKKRDSPVPPSFIGPGVAGRTQQFERLAPKLASLVKVIAEKQLKFGDASSDAVAEEILVLEIAGSLEEFRATLAVVEGMECLLDEDTEFQPAHGFKSRGERKEDEPVTGLLYLIATNQIALRQLMVAWEAKKDGKRLQGVASKFGAILDRVIDIRPWGTTDRLREIDRSHWIEEIIDGANVIRFEAELWYRNSKPVRDRQVERLATLVTANSGRVISHYEHTGSAYHGIIVELPADNAVGLLENPEISELFQLESVYHFWCVGQSVGRFDPEGTEESQHPSSSTLPTGSPLVALLDGMPIANHPLLAGRLEVDDPDDWETDYPVESRRHGTEMASVICHGDLSSGSKPLPCPLYVRPIMKPSPAGTEWIPNDERPNDLLQRCIRRIKVGEGNLPPEAPTVQIINLSLGDDRRVFDGLHHSAWARMIDWLQYRYNVLIIVSAGNATSFAASLTQTQFEALEESAVEKAIFEARFAETRQLRIISPAETLNGLTVGASHADEAGPPQLGVLYRLAVFHPDLPSPYSRIGPGFRGAVKPELLMPGGRAPLMIQNGEAKTYQQSRSPGIRVASPPASSGDTAREAFTRGTSPAAALASREAAFIVSRIQDMDVQSPPAEFHPVLAKSLLIHSASWHSGEARLREHFGRERKAETHAWKPKKIMPQLGYGRLREPQGVSSATVLGWGEIAADRVMRFSFPIPACLQGKKGKRRFTVTLAWFSPINSSNRRYRVAKLSLKFPESVDDLVASNSPSDVGANVGGKGTVQHEVFEGRAPRGIVDDDFAIDVECIAEGGSIDDPVRFGLAVTLEGEENIFPELREQIQERLRVKAQVQV